MRRYAMKPGQIGQILRASKRGKAAAHAAGRRVVTQRAVTATVFPLAGAVWQRGR